MVFHRLPCLHNTVGVISQVGRDQSGWSNVPDDGGLDDVFTILIDCLQDVSRLRLLFSFEWGVELNTDLLGFEVCTDTSADVFER